VLRSLAQAWRLSNARLSEARLNARALKDFYKPENRERKLVVLARRDPDGMLANQKRASRLPAFLPIAR